jgi:hypothetical protein
MEPERVPASIIREKISDNAALLVCAYDDDDKFSQFHLDGAIGLSEFKTRAGRIDPDMDIYFYCA